MQQFDNAAPSPGPEVAGAEGLAYDHELDVRGLNCPLPILNMKKTVHAMPNGHVLKILATDRGAASDFQSFARQTGLTLLAWHEREGEFHFYIRKP